MKQEELENFVNNHQEETQILEYKQKPNFNNIKEAIDHIKDRMHYNIYKTIYAFANTDGGTLFIGIEEHKKNKHQKYEITGIDKTDENIVEGILNKVTEKIDKRKDYIELKDQKRKVLKIDVQPLKWGYKPQLLDGVLYVRKGDKTEKVPSFEEATPVYIKEQFYLFLIKGLRKNLEKSINGEDTFTAVQFIDGLTTHVNTLAQKHQTDAETSKNAVQFLEDIKNAIKTDKNLLKTTLSPDTSVEDKNKLVNDFINHYKSIIQMGV